MATKFCGTLAPRNLTNATNISGPEWITNIISLIIFFVAFIGNTAALIVMFGPKGPIRLTNNRYLANLACADLLRACFMPFTILARMKKNFIFGKMICRILPIVQSLSVAVDVFTLVCISIERYLAICHPLLILQLQSNHFSNLHNGVILIAIWSLGLLISLPNFYLYNLCSLPKPGRFKCEKIAVQEFDERLYMITLDAFYFVIPMAVMIVLYTLIIWKMYRNSTARRMRSFQNTSTKNRLSLSSPLPLSLINQPIRLHQRTSDIINDHKSQKSLSFDKIGLQSSHHSSSRSRSGCSVEELEPNLHNESKQTLNREPAISHPNYPTARTLIQPISVRKMISETSCSSSPQGTSRLDRNRRKALKLLITLIVEFFICWTPLYIYHTIGIFYKNFYRQVPSIFVDLILLFSFASASCNPLTYYFMSQRYRSVLYAYLSCCNCTKNNRFCHKHKHHQATRSIKAI